MYHMQHIVKPGDSKLSEFDWHADSDWLSRQFIAHDGYISVSSQFSAYNVQFSSMDLFFHFCDCAGVVCLG